MTNSMTSQQTLTRDEQIAYLNDRCRTGADPHSRRMMTRGCSARFVGDTAIKTITAQLGLLAKLRHHVFDDEDGPLRDHGSIEYLGETIHFIIDTYDLEYRYGSEDPANPAVTRRVLTLMLRDDL